VGVRWGVCIFFFFSPPSLYFLCSLWVNLPPQISLPRSGSWRWAPNKSAGWGDRPSTIAPGLRTDRQHPSCTGVRIGADDPFRFQKTPSSSVACFAALLSQLASPLKVLILPTTKYLFGCLSFSRGSTSALWAVQQEISFPRVLIDCGRKYAGNKLLRSGHASDTCSHVFEST
jgi:hypothetical protein